MKNLYMILLASIAIAGCTGDTDNSVFQQKEITLKNFSNTGCKPSTRIDGNDCTDGSYFELTATKGNMLYVKHINAMFNCSSRTFEAKVEVDGNSITVSEYDMTVNELATTCLCPFDLGYEIGPLEEGTTYSFKIITGKGPDPLYPDMAFETHEVSFDIVYTSTLSKNYNGKELSEPFCVEGKTWTMRSSPAVSPEHRTWSYTETRLMGDTIINGIRFMGMYSRSWKEGESIPEEWIKTQHFLGEDNSKIYRYTKDNDKMRVILDFSLQTDDTFFYAEQVLLTVMETSDSTFVGSTDGAQRRCIHLGSNGVICETWAEGIGSLQFGITDALGGRLGMFSQFIKCYTGDKILYSTQLFEARDYEVKLRIKDT